MTTRNGNGNGNGNGTKKGPVGLVAAYDRRASLLFALDDTKDKPAPPPVAPAPAPSPSIKDAKRLVWHSNAALRAGPPDFKLLTPSKRIPQWSSVTITAINGDFAEVKDASGASLGWTKQENLRLLYKDRSALTSAPLAPATAISVNSGWSDEKKNIAEVYNRIGGVVEACSKESGADVASILAVLFVETGGGAKPARMDIRVEVHILWDEWGHEDANKKTFDEHFRFGQHAPWTGPKCPTRSSCHRYRDSTKDDWTYPHKEGTTDEEYKMLAVINKLAGGDVAYRCMSMGLAQVMGRQHQPCGYDSAKAMFDALEKSEAAQLFAFFDEAQESDALAELVAKSFKKFARLYNGTGKETEYSTKMKNAFDAATAVLASRTATPAPPKAAPAPTKTPPPTSTTKSLGTDEATERRTYLFSSALDNRKPVAIPAVSWASDADSIDYSHLGVPMDTTPFELTPAHLATLAKLNAFDVGSAERRVLFALRGCSLVTGDDSGWVDKVQLTEAKPDHTNDRCVVGVWNRDDGKFRVFKGSTVPNQAAMIDQFNNKKKANLIPTGWYRYHNGDHNTGALLIADAFRQLGKIVVLRSLDDLTYTTRDTWDVTHPADNIHASRNSDDTFSSYGCVTVKGTFDIPPANTHHGQWASFRTSAGLLADSSDPEGSKAFHLMLLTGREARCVAVLKDPSSLKRLRFGSSGADVKTLQEALVKAGYLKDKPDGDMGANTVKALIDWQRAQNPSKPSADGIFSATHAKTLGVAFSLDVDLSESMELTHALDDKTNTKIINCPVINDQKSGDNVGLRWNREPAKGEPLDVVVHLHGFREHGKQTDPFKSFEVSLVLERSGLGFDPIKGVSPRARATLGIAPRGERTGNVTGTPGQADWMAEYAFSAVSKAGGLESLIGCGVSWLEKNKVAADARPVAKDHRLILTAHSGGGFWVDLATKTRDPAEIHLFDALYQPPKNIRNWAVGADGQSGHIGDDADMLAKEPRKRWELCMVTLGHALRVICNPPHSHESDSCWIAREIETRLSLITNADIRDFLGKYYRVERATTEHMLIPSTFGPPLLADPGAALNDPPAKKGGPDRPLTHVDLTYCKSYIDKWDAAEKKKGAADVKSKGLSESVAVGHALDDKTNTSFQNCPVIDSQFEGKNVALRWNRAPAKGEPLDVVVHLHGFNFHTKDNPPNPFPISDVLERSGIMFDAIKGKAPPPPRARATLSIAPRGEFNGVTSNGKMDKYWFSAVSGAGGLESLIKCGVSAFEKKNVAADAQPVARDRLILHAHSGGGAWLNSTMGTGKRDPAEIHLFDAIYEQHENVRAWAVGKDGTKGHIGGDADMLSKEPRSRWELCMVTLGHALRVVFNPDSSKTLHTCWLARAIEERLKLIPDAAIRDFLGRYYRVERTAEVHMDIPVKFARWILADSGANLEPAVTRVDIAYCDAFDAAEAAKKAKAKGQAFALVSERPVPSIW